jgi:hypothetical protein
MSKLKIRIALSVLISLGVIFAIATTVQGASMDSAAEKVSSHSAVGVMTNFNQGQLQGVYQSERGPGHDCGSDYGPID